MSASRAVRCPGCNAVFKLKSEIPEGKGIRCSQCGTAFKFGYSSTSEGIQEAGSSLPPRQHGPTSRTRRPSRNQSSSFGAWLVGAILVGVILVAFVFVAGIPVFAPKPATPVTSSSSSSKPAVQQSVQAAPEQPETTESIMTETVEAQADTPETIRFFVAEGAEGLELVSIPDGHFTDTSVGKGSSQKRALKLNRNYLYLDISDELLFDVPEHHTEPYAISLEFFDEKPGTLDLQYDGHQFEADAPHDGRWKTTEKISLEGSETWKQVSFILTNVKFANRQQGKADFRLRTEPAAAISVREISLIPKDEFSPSIASKEPSSGTNPSDTFKPQNNPLDPVTPDDLAPGFRVTWFADTDFEKQIRQEVLQKPIDFFWEKSPGEGIDEDGWSTRYEGVLPIPQAGDYEFHLKSDDGSRLWIDNELIVDNWELHGPEIKSEKTRLEAGLHQLRIDHYDDQYGAHLTFRMTNPTTGKPENFPLALMRHDSRKSAGWKLVQGSSEPKEPPAASPENPVVLAGEGAELRLVKNVELQTPPSHGGFHSYDFSSDGKMLAGGTGLGGFTSGGKTTKFGGEVLLWNPRTGRLTETLGSHGASVSSVMFSDDGKTLVSVSNNNGLIKVWNVASKKEIQRIQLEGDYSSDKPVVAPLVAISPEGKYLAATASVPKEEGSNVYEHRKLNVWELSTGKEQWSLEDGILEAMTFSPDGLALLAAVRHLEESGTDSRGRKRYKQNLEIVEIDVESGKITTRNPPAQKRTLDEIAFVGDPQKFAGLSSGGLTLRDLDTNETVGQFEWHDDRPFFNVYGFSSDGRYLLRGNNEFLELSDLEEGKVIGLMTTEFPDLLWNLAISDDLKKVVCNFDHEPTIFEITGVVLPRGE